MHRSASRSVGGALGGERFARARAQLDAGLERDALFAEGSGDAATWLAEEEALLARLADDVERGDFANVEAYLTVYRATWAELTGIAALDEPVSVQPDPSSRASLPQDQPSQLPSPLPIDQPNDTMPIAPGLVIDEPLPFRRAEPPTLLLTPGLSSAPRLTRGQ